MPVLGDRIEAIGMGKMFVDFVPGATGFGEIIHIGEHGETQSSEKFTQAQRRMYEDLFPTQYNHGIFYIDEGVGPHQPLYLDFSDVQLANQEEE